MERAARAASEFTRLMEIMATLRGPDGCPWDREQTIDSLKPFVLEETYEVLEAIDRHDHSALAEELGDFVFEAVFLAQLEFEAGRFDMADSLKQVADKLVRRHPHVFRRHEGAPKLDSAEAVRTRWEEIKAQEKADKAGGTSAGKDTQGALLGGIAPTLPALLRAFHIGMRAASVGFDWTNPGDVVAKIQEEVDEVRDAVGGPRLSSDPLRVEEEIGDLLFAIANLSRKLGVEPETALRKANDKFTRRFAAMERAIGASGRTLGSLPLVELEAQWEQVKARETPSRE